MSRDRRQEVRGIVMENIRKNAVKFYGTKNLVWTETENKGGKKNSKDDIKEGGKFYGMRKMKVWTEENRGGKRNSKG